MIRSVISRVSLSVCVLAAAPLIVVACSSDASPVESTTTGTLNLPLVTSAGGNIYRLDAIIYIYGPTYTQLYTSDDPNETTLSTVLQTGSYTAYLNNYQLLKRNEAGQFVPVSATLVSNYYAYFSIFDRTTTTISFQFETDGVIVQVGAGNLNVEVGVTETPPICNVLGDGCSDGLWCAPPELTGSPLACVTAGSVAAGEACSGPTDCVANASCFDFGGGPYCAELCLKPQFGKACASGGTCVEAGSEYGICVPENGTLPGVGGGSNGGGNSGGFGGKGGFGGSNNFGGSSGGAEFAGAGGVGPG
jgi:uncharacterized membrane protein YgcG